MPPRTYQRPGGIREHYAEDHNLFLDTANNVRVRKTQTPTTNRGTDNVVLVRHSLGRDLPQGSVLSLREPLDPANIDMLAHGPVFEGVQPTATDLGNFVVVPFEAVDETVVQCQHSGIAYVRLEVTSASHEFCDIKAGSDTLVSLSEGTAKILWKEAGTGANKRAMIRFPIESTSSISYLQISGNGYNVAQPFTDVLHYWPAKIVSLELNTTTYDWNVTEGADVVAVSLRDSGRALPQKGEIYRGNLVSADSIVAGGLPVYEIVPDSHANWYVESNQIVQVALNPGGQIAYLPFQLNDAHLGNGGNAAYGDIQRGWTNGTQPDEITCRRGGGWWFNLEFLMEIGSAVSVDITMFWELNTVRVGERVFKLRPGAAAVSTSLTHQLMRDFEIGDDLRFGIVQTQSSTISTNDVTYFTCHGMPM